MHLSKTYYQRINQRFILRRYVPNVASIHQQPSWRLDRGCIYRVRCTYIVLHVLSKLCSRRLTPRWSLSLSLVSLLTGKSALCLATFKWLPQGAILSQWHACQVCGFADCLQITITRTADDKTPLTKLRWKAISRYMAIGSKIAREIVNNAVLTKPAVNIAANKNRYLTR